MKSLQTYIKKRESATNLSKMFVFLPFQTVFTGVCGSGKSIRKLFASKHEDAGRGILSKATMQDFSFNSKGGCPACGGKGIIVSDMAFMESIETVCGVCHGTRYNQETLQYRYKGKNIAEVMDLSVEEAICFFAGQPFQAQLQALKDVGLGYLHLNQSMSTLSGGELQRIKLATFLHKKGEIFILDEPTDGLHLDDIRKLLVLFNQMVDDGNTLILIEHSLEIMKTADHIIELGPGGGEAGGQLLFSGTPQKMLKCKQSVTRNYLSE